MRAEDVIAEGPTILSGSGAGPAGLAEDRLEPGARAGDYEITGFLGAGAMGEVYAARHPLIGKRAAVKVIRRHLATSPDAIERFLREARAVNQVGHANVVDVFAVGRLEDGRLYLVMDLLEGESLAARLRRGKPAVDEVLRVLDAVAAALDAAHARGVVHRDLKPDNVFLAQDLVFVLDFGIAKLLSTPESALVGSTLTEQGAWVGTPAYMAPEQWGADGAGPASDRYALGVIAFELLSGARPFEASSLPAMMEQHLRAPVPTLASRPVDAVLARALAKIPDERFPTARAFVDALRAALEGSAPLRRGRARAARRPVIVAALGGATAVAAIATAVVVLDRPAARTTTTPAPAALAIELATTPPGARVWAGGVDRGATPLSLNLADLDGGDVELRFEKPGYAPAVRLVPAAEPPASLRVTLAPVAGFEGVWALPDGALREFERRGEQVAMFSRDSGTGERTFERFFEFAPGDSGVVTFVASEEHVDPRGANDPSCHVPLRAEYRYEPDGDYLERRQERVQLDVADGRCALRAKEWAPAAPLRRIASAGDDGWVESRAGSSANTAVAPEPPDAPEPAKTEPVQKKRAPRKQPKTAPNPEPKADPKGDPKTAPNEIPIQSNTPPPSQIQQQTRQ